MNIHILGICGTFMAGIAAIAREAGHSVSGSDANVYPPMSTQLTALGIELTSGYTAANIPENCDCIIVGNAISRGNPAMEYILEKNIPYISGPEWLAKNILQNRWVLAVSGTHGKTTTTSLLTWILEAAGKAPGFLIGGVPENFGVSARIGKGSYFVIEADEYDTAFFDKRSKFIHYHPKTLILNNLEFDHADIFPNLDAIKQQFHYLVRTVPGNGLIVRNENDANLQEVLKKGCWTPTTGFSLRSGEWQAELINKDGSCFNVLHQGEMKGQVKWNLLGDHNVENALASLAAAFHIGIEPKDAIPSLTTFKNVKRRLEVKGSINGITVYDDFAHHPTAIATTLAGLRSKIGNERIIAVLEFGSYTMRTGVHKDSIQDALYAADMVICKQAEENSWDLESVLNKFQKPTALYPDVDKLIAGIIPQLRKGDHVVVMSNSGFGGIHEKLLSAIGDH